MDDPFDHDLAGAVAVVTGAGAGIGAATASALAAAGARVLVNDLDAAAAATTAASIVDRYGNGRAAPLGADVGEPATAKRLVQAAHELGGRLDVLVNNAGVGHDVTPATELDEAVADRLFRVNLRSQMLCCREAIGPMADAGGGRIINVGSRSWLGAPGQVDYAATKGGTVSLTRGLAAEVADRGITVNAVVPGTIVTPAFADLDEQTRDDLVARHPMGRFGVPDDIARAVRFLASPRSGSITGQILHVCGGRSIYGGPRQPLEAAS